jgi:hypothetical protein
VRVLALLAAACSPVEDLGPTGLMALPERGMQLASEPVMLEPGKETTRCYYANLRNPSPIDVARFQTAQRTGQHHFNIFASDLTFDDGFQRCPTNEELFVGARPIVDGSGGSVDYPFPGGMAYRLEPNTLLIFQLHWINPTASPAEQQFVLNLHTPPEPPKTLVDIYGFTNFRIDIPPNEAKVETKECAVYDSIGLLTMSAHFHARGTLATAELIPAAGAPRSLYETRSWDDPDVVVFPEAVRVIEGDRIRFACHYENREDRRVTYGPSSDDEMCFVFGYYFPKVGLIPCF